jgi:hypothetical protein
MQRFELSPNDKIKLLTWEPLLIVWLSIVKPGLPNTIRPGRKKPYQDHTFDLRIPLELEDGCLDSLKMEQPYLIMLASTCLMKTTPNTAPHSIMGDPRSTFLLTWTFSLETLGAR